MFLEIYWVLFSDGEVRLSATDLHAGNYHVVGVDLRNLVEVQQKLAQSEINFELPTVFIAECVLVYIETSLVKQLLTWIVSAFPTAFFINYEQVVNLFLFLFIIKCILTEPLQPRHNRLLGITNPVSLKYFSLKSVLNSVIGLPNSVTLTTAWLWMATAAIDTLAHGAIAIYSFLCTHLIAVFI